MASQNGETAASRIEWSVQAKQCAFCGKSLKNIKIVGSGSFKDGLFCSLDCFSKFHSERLKNKSQNK